MTRVICWVLLAGIAFLAPSVAEAARFGLTKQETVVRQGPAQDAKALGKLPTGKRVMVVKIQGDWLQVKFRIKKGGKVVTRQGWVARDRVKPLKKVAPKSGGGDTAVADAGGSGDPSPGKTPAPDPEVATVDARDSAGEEPSGEDSGGDDEEPPPAVVARQPYLGPMKTGISVEAGAAALTSSYTLESGTFTQDTGTVVHFGGHVAASYYILPYVGVVASFQGGTGVINANIAGIQVDGLQTRILQASAAAVGRYSFGPVIVYGSVGYRYLNFAIPNVANGAGQNVFLKTNTYTGVTAGLGVGYAIGKLGTVTLGGEYWVLPSLSESGGSNATGTEDGIVGISAEFAARFKLTRNLGASLVLGYTQLGTSFTGTGQRFGRSVTDATVSDQFLSAGVAASYLF